MEYKLGHQLKNNCLVGWYLLLGRGFFPYEKKKKTMLTLTILIILRFPTLETLGFQHTEITCI